MIELRDVTMIHRARGGKLFHPTLVRAMDHVNLSVHRGETLGIVGESGCGKSTTARVMVGLQKPTSGEVCFYGEPLGRHARDRKALGRAVSVVFQDPATALNPRLPIRQVLMDPLNVHNVGTRDEREARSVTYSAWLACPIRSLTCFPGRSRVASGSASPSPVPSRWIRTSSLLMSRPLPWMCRCVPRS
ncbi:oligopeptide transport system ATP-binding protein [Cutibacterium acnes JCM 18909]|nr:oligopeptide transport system ATP-binding protein [Cutibacterium acnes JCM 18909]